MVRRRLLRASGIFRTRSAPASSSGPLSEPCAEMHMTAPSLSTALTDRQTPTALSTDVGVNDVDIKLSGHEPRHDLGGLAGTNHVVPRPIFFKTFYFADNFRVG
jgi:hypothetical protein